MALFGLIPDVNTGLARQAANQSADLTKAGAKDATKSIKKNYGKAAENLMQIGEQFAPYQQSGSNLNSLYTDALGANGQAGYDNALGAFHQGPGFQFGLDAANQNIMRNNAALGGLASGGTYDALGREAQGRQNQEYNTWLDNLFRGSGQGLLASQGAAQGLQSLGSLYQNKGNNLAQIELGKASNLASNQQQLGQNLQGAQTANAQNSANLWGNILGLGATGLGSLFG
jgi:hypothetical protein